MTIPGFYKLIKIFDTHTGETCTDSKHSNMLGSTYEINLVGVGLSCYMVGENDKSPFGNWALTTRVKRINISDDLKDLEIETKNTKYVFERASERVREALYEV